MKIHNINEFITSPDMSGYESPIRMIVGEMETKMEADTMSVIQRYGIDVDKEELIKALNYDREQYEKGYRDGQANPPQAEWVDDFECYGSLYHKCSHCHFSILRAAHESFCSHCGYKMSNVEADRI